MKLVNSSGVYSFILTETEWYFATEQEQQAWRNQCQREMAENDCKYAAILVDPDAIMSCCVVQRRHKVWGYAEPTTAAQSFRGDLVELRHDALNTGLSRAQIATIVNDVFK